MDDTWLLTIIYPKLLYIKEVVIGKGVEFVEDEIIAKSHHIVVITKFPEETRIPDKSRLLWGLNKDDLHRDCL